MLKPENFLIDRIMSGFVQDGSRYTTDEIRAHISEQLKLSVPLTVESAIVIGPGYLRIQLSDGMIVYRDTSEG